MKARGFFLPSFWSRSITMTRLGTPICTAARPMPSAAYIDVDHVVDQLADPVIDLVDVGRDRFEARIGRGKDGSDGHEREIGERLPAVKSNGKTMELGLILLASRW